MPSYLLKIQGQASQKLVKQFNLDSLEMTESQGLMGWLRKQSIPVASSCYGDGVCKRCKIILEDQSELLSCMTTLKELFRDKNEITIYISYL